MSTLEKDLLRGAEINSAGYGIIAKLAMQDRGLNIGAKAVYAYFCSFAGAGNSCFPSRDKICFDLNISKDTVGKHISQLALRGYIAVEQVKTGGRFSHNIYTILSEVKPVEKMPDTKPPCPKNSDTEKTGHDELVSNNNNFNINSSFNNNNLKSSEPDKPVSRSRFVKPTLEEVEAYCRERGNNVNPERFIDYYNSNGWKVGRNPMKDWRAAVRNWEKGDTKRNKPTPTDYGDPMDFYK